MSEVARMFVFELLLLELFPVVESETWSWSTATLTPTEKLWADGFVQVTDQEAGAPTVVGADVARDVSATVCGLAEEVVQSPGSVSVNVVSALVGP
jgi:hypothetical protein